MDLVYYRQVFCTKKGAYYDRKRRFRKTKILRHQSYYFLTGLDSYDSNPSTTFFRNDCIQYEGKYYTVGSHRIEYTRYKTYR